jgi:hypothetical protein
MRHRHHPLPSTQRGIGALIVVLVLFFILAMVALYTSRNLIFEQKTSANTYRSTQAFEAAEAGLEWAIAMLNGGRVDDQCVGTADIARDTFRDRHLSIDANRVVTRKTWLDAGVPTGLQPSCVLGANGGWVCSCPPNAAPALVAPAGTGPTPTFRITFEDVAGPRGLLVRVISDGCSSFGTPCVAGAAGGSDARATVSVLLGLAPSLTQTPAAALTVRGTLTASGALSVTNADAATNHVTIDAGGAINLLSVERLPAMVSGDSTLSDGLAPVGGQTAGEMLFLSTFGMPPAAYRTQPAVVRMTCAVACDLQAKADQYPGHVIWVDGPLVVDAGAVVTLGSAASPAILVAGGDITFGAGSTVRINGLVYSRGARMTTTGSDTQISGAFIAEGDPAIGDGAFEVVGAPSIVFDRAIVDHLVKAQERRVMDFGSFVSVPGSWKDFQ